MVSGSRPGPSKAFSAHRGGKLYAARKQRAIFSAQRPSLSSLKTKHPNRFRYLEKTYGGRNGTSSNYARNRTWDHYDGREGRGERGRLEKHDSGWRVQRRRFSRSMSPTARDRYDAVEQDAAYFDYDKPHGEGDFWDYQSTKLRYNDGEFGDDHDSDWEDELKVLDEVDGRDGGHRTGTVKKAELEYLKRMLTKLRNRHKELFSHRSRGNLPRGRGNLRYNRNGDNYDRKPAAPPPSPSRYHRRSRSPRRHHHSLEHTRENHHYGSGKSRRRYSYTHGESKISQLAPLSNQLKTAVRTRTYPTRNLGRALHVQRWLSDRYTKQTMFNFGELPRSEGVKKYYILDPNNPNRYMNVPRPSQPAPGARGDYYRGAAWGAYQQEKQEWLETQGCHYPDAWVSADGEKGGDNDGDTSMIGSGSEVTTSADASMSDAESDTTVRGPNGARGNSFSSRQATPGGDEMDTASEVSEDLISLDADNDNGVLLPVLLDSRIADISSMIQQTTIIDNQASPIPAIATTFMSALSEFMPLAEVTQVPAAVDQPAPILSPVAAVAENDTNDQETFRVANPSTVASHVHPLVPQCPATIGDMEQQNVSIDTIALAVLSQETTAIPALEGNPALVANLAAVPTTIPSLSLHTTNVIIPDEDWNKEWEGEWRYHF